MAAIERKELTHSYTAEAETGGGQKRAQLALVKTGAGKDGARGNGHVRALPPARQPAPSSPQQAEAVGAEEFEARGLAAWWRLAQIARVLGTMSLYLFLNDYDIRADFNRRAAGRRLEEARAGARFDYFKAWARDLVLRRALDRVIRLVRFVVYRGAEGTGAKERQL